jgi:hypothetical protein
MKYFTWYGVLDTEKQQVILYKSFMLGGIRTHYVDIRNLEKVDAEAIPNDLMWTGNLFDKDLVFRYASSDELFVFDKFG